MKPTVLELRRTGRLAQQPEAMQLRYMQTMTQVAGDRASTVVFPLPMDLLGSLLSKPGPARPSEP